jgi:hypothetical protein
MIGRHVGWDWLKTVFLKNQFLQAVLVPSLLGGVYYLVNSFVSYVMSLFTRSITVKNTDTSFDSIVEWLGRSDTVAVESMALIAETYKKKNKTWKDWKQEHTMGVRKAPKLSYKPATSNDLHIIK